VSGWLSPAEYADEWRRLGDGDPYYRPEFLAAAALAEDAEPAAFSRDGVLYPFLVRSLPDGRCDLTSAYGFAGPSAAGDWRAAFRAACTERGVVSEFIRFHPVRQNQRFAGDDVALTHVQEMIVLDLDGDDDELVRRMVPQARNKLRKAIRRGVTVSAGRDLERFWELYTDAMRGVGAAGGYLFPLAYFEALDALGDGLLMLDAMHYFLSASTDEGRRSAATNLVIYEAMRIARDSGLAVLNLGGGLREGDALHGFKCSFGPGRAPYYVGSAIHDQACYRRLCERAGVDPAGPYFPAYRRPAAVAADG
jgi:hypothetical protein